MIVLFDKTGIKQQTQDNSRIRAFRLESELSGLTLWFDNNATGFPPEGHKIDETSGKLRQKTTQELVDEKVINLLPTQKIVDNVITEKTLEEKYTQKLVTAEEVNHYFWLKLSAEVETFLESTREPVTGTVVNKFVREKCILSFPYKAIPDDQEPKKSLIESGLVYATAKLTAIQNFMQKIDEADKNARTKMLAQTTVAGKNAIRFLDEYNAL